MNFKKFNIRKRKTKQVSTIRKYNQIESDINIQGNVSINNYSTECKSLLNDKECYVEIEESRRKFNELVNFYETISLTKAVKKPKEELVLSENEADKVILGVEQKNAKQDDKKLIFINEFIDLSEIETEYNKIRSRFIHKEEIIVIKNTQKRIMNNEEIIDENKQIELLHKSIKCTLINLPESTSKFSKLLTFWEKKNK